MMKKTRGEWSWRGGARGSAGSPDGRNRDFADSKVGREESSEEETLRSQAQRPGPRDAWIATATLSPGSL